MLFNALNLIFLNVTMLNCTKKIFTKISLAGLYHDGMPWTVAVKSECGVLGYSVLGLTTC